MIESDFSKFFASRFQRTSSFTTGFMLMLVDCFSILLSIGITFFIVNFINHSWINFRSFVTYSVYFPALIMVFFAAGMYPGIMLPPGAEVRKSAILTFFSFAGIALSIVVESDEHIPTVTALLLACPVATILIPTMREMFRHLFAKQRFWGIPAVIYSNDKSAKVIIDRLIDRPEFSYKPAIIIDSKATGFSFYRDIPVFPPSDAIHEEIKKTGIKVAIISGWSKDTDRINSYYRYTIFVDKIQESNTITTSVRDFGGIIGFSSVHHLTFKTARIAKRTLDLFLLLISAPLTIPVTLIVAVLVKLTSRGPVFYGHKRIGKNGKEFKCWKFRSMVVDADKQLEKILAENPAMRAEWEKDRKFTNDPRVTRLGKILRKTSLDEIPQFFNILTGEMSFVGPRPVTTPELTKYGDKVNFILSVTPGLSGMWQISGRSDTGYEERITLDAYYIHNWTIWLDLWILIKTVYVVLKGKGAY